MSSSAEDLASIASNKSETWRDNKHLWAGYGVTPATLTALQTRIDACRLSNATPTVAKTTKRSFTQLLDEELRRADMICKERLDGLMEQFRESEERFYMAYHAARNIIDTGRKKKPTPPNP